MGNRVALIAATLLIASNSTVHGTGIFGNTGLAGGFRWDAAPRTIGGLERSLDGGLRYSVSGGNLTNFRDSFNWSGGAPSLPLFTQTVNEAFAAWTAVDPVTTLGTTISFTPDFGTAVDNTLSGGVRLGAEIDLFAFNFGDTGTHADTAFNAQFSNVTLTSGTTNYAGGGPITGSDIRINNNPGATYSIDVFRLLLTHEIGHAIGLADVDLNSGPNGTFIDDNYNGANNATALATLTNSWALLVNPLNPAASAGLSLYTVANGAPGIDTPGVNILMESEGLGGQFGNLSPMANDDYGGRQFLYPTFVPEPSLAVLLSGAALARRRRRS
jgi:hypothetical protein